MVATSSGRRPAARWAAASDGGLVTGRVGVSNLLAAVTFAVCMFFTYWPGVGQMSLFGALSVSAVAAAAVWLSGRTPVAALIVAGAATVAQPVFGISFEAMDIVVVFVIFQAAMNTSLAPLKLLLLSFLILTINDAYQRWVGSADWMQPSVLYPALLTLELRQERSGDHRAVAQLHCRAFGDAGPQVAALAASLRTTIIDRQGLSLVAVERSGEILGHVMFTRGWLDTPRRLLDVQILSPLGVAPDHQRSGIGAALVRRGLAELAEWAVPVVFLEGSPGILSALRLSTRRRTRIPQAVVADSGCRVPGAGGPRPAARRAGVRVRIPG